MRYTDLIENNNNFTPEQISDIKHMIRQWNSGSTGGRYRDEVEEEIRRRGYNPMDVIKMADYISSISHHG